MIPTKMKPITMRIILHTMLYAMFRKDYNTVVEKLLPVNPFVEDSFINRHRIIVRCVLSSILYRK